MTWMDDENDEDDEDDVIVVEKQKIRCAFCFNEYVNILKHHKTCKSHPDNQPKAEVNNQTIKWLIDEFQVIKTYLRKGVRPAQLKAIENFEKHLKEVV